MSKISKSEVLSILVIIISLLIVVFYIRVQVPVLKQLNLNLSSKSSEINKKQTTLNTVEALKTKLEKDPSLASKLKIAFPSSIDSANFMVELSEIAKISNVELLNIYPTSQNNSRQSDSSFTVALRGSYGNFNNFLKNIETNSRLISVKSIGLSGIAKDNSSLISANLTLEAFAVK